MKKLIAGYFCLLPWVVFAQVTETPRPTAPVTMPIASPDTTVFSAGVFFELIRQNHPIVKQANLFGEEARQVLMQARGAFDPKYVSYYDRKEFGGDLYYDYWRNKLSVPLWTGGIDLNVSYDRNSDQGKYINPAERTPASGLAGVGLSVPIGQGLLIDARRNAIRQGRLAVDLAEADRLELVNKTLYEAAKTYWDWFFAHQQRRLLIEGYALANQRFRALRERALIGDAAIIDTTEALITAQERLVQRQQAEVEEQNARLLVGTFLWNDANQPVELPATALPQEPPLRLPDEDLFQTLLDQARQHPNLLQLAIKSQQFTLEERFRRAMIQPQIMLSASLLSEAPNADSRYDWNGSYALRPQNYKIGVDVAFPLFLRKERGKLREVQVKNQQVVLERQQVGRDITNGVQSAYNQTQALARQVAFQQQAVANQQLLVAAELQKFALGESSLFLINTRETKLIDLRVKGEELKSKYQKAVAELYFAAGTGQ